MDDLKLALSSFDRKEGYKIYKAKKDVKGQAADMTYENLFKVVDQFINLETQNKPVKTPKKEVSFGTKQVDLFTESENQIEDEESSDLNYAKGIMSEEDDDDLPEIDNTGGSATEENCNG